MKYALGIDIGGTNTKLGVCDTNGMVLAKDNFNTTDYKNFDGYYKAFLVAVKNIIASQSGDCIGIGIGAPNGNFLSGCIENAPNLPFPKIAPLVDNLKTDLNIDDIYLTNDANAAAMGEKIYGGAKNIKNFITITLGTGLGSGIVVDGKMLYGHDGMAGELGHTCIKENGRLCNCGKHGCLETYASATGIKRTFFEMMIYYGAKYTELSRYNWDDIDPKIIEDAANAGDIVAKATYDFTGNILGIALANFVTFSSPEAIFLFGGPVKSGDLLLKPTKESMEKNMFPQWKNKIKLIPSHLSESNAAILGSSALVWDAVRK